MKLHLPKLLLTAVLAACVAPAAWGEDMYEIDGTINGGNLDLLDYYGGNGVFIRAASGQDVTDEVGILTVQSDLAKLVLAGHYPNQSSSASSFESLTIGTLKVGENGTGNVNLQVGTQQGTNTKSNTVTIGGVQGTITGLELANNSTLTLSGALATTAGSSWTLAAGTNLILNNAGTIVMRNGNNDNTAVKTTGTGTLTIGNGTTIELANTGQMETCAIEGAITVKGGGTLLLSGNKSLLGYNNNSKGALTLEGSSADSKAVVNITSTQSQHLSRNLVMKGNAEIKGIDGAYLTTYPTNNTVAFTISGTNNTISVDVHLESGVNVSTTNASDKLTISGDISHTDNKTDAFIKSGAGTLTLSGTNTFNGELKVNAGQLDISGLTTANKLVTVASTGVLTTKGSGRVAFNNGLSLSGSMTIESGSNVSLAGNSILNKAITNNGMLELGGVIDINSLEGDTTSTFDDPDKNGFETISANYEVVTGTGVSNVTTTESLRWKIGTNLMQGTLNSGTLSIADSKGTTYYVSKGNINRAALITNTAASGVREDTLFALNGGVLQLSAGETMNGSQVIVTDEGGTSTISLADTSILTNGSSLLSKVTGGGTVEIATTGGYGSTFTANSGFTGTTHVKSGNFEINSITFGNKLKLGGGVNFQLSSGSTYEFAAGKELILEGSTQVHQNGGATFNFNGNVSGNGTFIRQGGGGNLTFNGTVSLGIFEGVDSGANSTFNGESNLTKLNVKAGKIYYGAGTHSVNLLDMSCEGNVGVGTVTLKKNDEVGKQVVVTASTLWLRSAATLNIEEGATLKLASNGIVNIKGTASGTTVSVASENGRKYLISGEENGGNATDYTISNAEVSVNTTSGAQTISNILSNSKLVNGGVNKLTADNASSTYSAIDATKGSIDILNAQEQTLSALTVGAGMAVGVYSGNSVPTKPTTADEATITVASLTAGTGATLNANLVLSNGATVTLANTLTMGSTLTLGEGMTLSGDLVSTIKGMSDDGTVDLFTGVDTLYLGGSTSASGALDATSGVNLDTYFAFEGASKYYLGYSGGNVFAGVIPEPTTATLSLLALAGLAARRRRK